MTTAANQVYTADTSPPAELHDTGMMPVEVIQKHSHIARQGLHSPSAPSQGSISDMGDAHSVMSRAAQSPVADSPLLRNGTGLVSDAEPATAEASDSGHTDKLPCSPVKQEPSQESPPFVTPPSEGEPPPGGYPWARETAETGDGLAEGRGARYTNNTN